MEIKYSTDEEAMMKEVVDKIKSIMDEVFQSHIGSGRAPYQLTDEAHIGSILLGMGVGTLRYDNDTDEFMVDTAQPMEVYWDGMKFAIVSRGQDLH